MELDPALSLTKRARADLLDIWDHIRADRSETFADDIVTRIVRACDVLKDHPRLGRARPDVAPDARMLVVDRWLVLYRVTAAGAQLVRVVDGARDLSAIRFRG